MTKTRRIPFAFNRNIRSLIAIILLYACISAIIGRVESKDDDDNIKDEEVKEISSEEDNEMQANYKQDLAGNNLQAPEGGPMTDLTKYAVFPQGLCMLKPVEQRYPKKDDLNPPTSSKYQVHKFDHRESRDFLRFLRNIHYDHRQMPDEEADEPVVVHVSVEIPNIRAVSEVTMDYSMEIFFRESWLDPRLTYDIWEFKNKTELVLHETYTNYIWHPDTFIPNAIYSKNPNKNSISHRSLLRLYSDGHILYSRRISVVAECSMDLTLFPFDLQVINFYCDYYYQDAYTADELVYEWSNGRGKWLGKVKAILLHKIELPDFRIKEVFVTSAIRSYSTGNFSRLHICFVFIRSAGFCLLQLIVPSTAIVFTAWISLWMEDETEFQDMISVMLAIVFLLFSYNEFMPRVSYLKALDVWLSVCFMTIFLSLIKLVLIKYMKQKVRIRRFIYEVNFISTHEVLRTLERDRFFSTHTGYTTVLSNGSIRELIGPQSDYYHCFQINGDPVRPRLPSIMKTNGYTSNGLAGTKMPSKVFNDEEDSKKKKLFSRLKHYRKMELTIEFINTFHWVTQWCTFIAFLLFAIFFFLVYPNIWASVIDPACKRENAEWFAHVP